MLGQPLLLAGIQSRPRPFTSSMTITQALKDLLEVERVKSRDSSEYRNLLRVRSQELGLEPFVLDDRVLDFLDGERLK